MTNKIRASVNEKKDKKLKEKTPKTSSRRNRPILSDAREFSVIPEA
jgi:hypothetical protein